MMRVSLKILRRSLRPVSLSCETSEIVNGCHMEQISYILLNQLR